MSSEAARSGIGWSVTLTPAMVQAVALMRRDSRRRKGDRGVTAGHAMDAWDSYRHSPHRP